ncbi:uncharacterized protein Z519_06979 [Cladophialophora bantiana CBS 173.52]|uniref:PhoD-like phosphatase domain-containing protein n=1 Tax=Cladophialophora bantiana (strain ATCC 10958 / CBS 173.52 / CDC B-1940 / NIH 8579) TaxID=1442370 RepID=A0A0D2FZW0_CLAB1|nr:uncharacterized protein Z519_06979 [Cladophialophora bantiana CBS 173.52]KIW91997.1 hypothetical protein Z519_06979 [Cladophialophora bantiana CBS 173.52]
MSTQASLYLACGPLLRFTGIYKQLESGNLRLASEPDGEIWRGSVMIVTADANSSYESSPTLSVFKQPAGQEASTASLVKLSRRGEALQIKPPELLERKDISIIENGGGLFVEPSAVPSGDGNVDSENSGALPGTAKEDQIDEIISTRLHAEQGHTFWKFDLQIGLSSYEARIGYRISGGPMIHFWIPARGQPMNIMFQSCNGFSLGVDTDLYSGPDPLWRDVLRSHQTRPFHVMIGGGDQLYNDECTVKTHYFKEWLRMKNGHYKRSIPFSQEMRDELEEFFLKHYTTWFSQGLFSVANAHIPMINIWDDHDIIDGFGSYRHRTMDCPVFAGLGATAFKFYMLFQHQTLPGTEDQERCWVLGAQPGPYIKELSRSLFMFLGAQIAFLGLDCRTERMRKQILSDGTWNLVFERCRREIHRGVTKHLIVLLGVPIAYPRLSFIEDVLSSRALAPLKALARSGILPHKLLNKYDGGVEILDDLDDHWTAKHHKRERAQFIKRLQELAAEKSVRVTILGGDVHLAAFGRFYSNRKLALPPSQDFRYMVNVTSSAITNRPPSETMAYIIGRFGGTRHVDHETDEDMIPVFAKDVDGTIRRNARLLPRRNWCSISGYLPGGTRSLEDGQTGVERALEQDLTGGLTIHLNVETVRGHPAGITTTYPLDIPLLDYRPSEGS